MSETTTVITDLAAIEALCREGVRVDVEIRGKQCRFEGHRLIPAESREVEYWLEKAFPPLLPLAEGEKEARYHFMDLEFRVEKEANRRKARALAIWFGFPAFQARAQVTGKGYRGQTAEDITESIERMGFEDDVLDMLFTALSTSVVNRQAQMGFTSGSSSLKS
jgi:hypothetical protein